MHDTRRQPQADNLHPQNPDPLFTVPQAAVYLNVRESFIRDLSKDRRIARVKLGRSVRIHQSELDRLSREGWQPALRPVARRW
jgi:excisionase family DNA binding protein